LAARLKARNVFHDLAEATNARLSRPIYVAENCRKIRRPSRMREQQPVKPIKIDR
jgi:hypothetical protein